jgi:hypothetical protein
MNNSLDKPIQVERLRRYCDLPSVLQLLSTKQITLLNPRYWDDKNDTHYLAAYKVRKELKSLLALCFTKSWETYHHWRVFSGGSGGACIVFKREPLLDRLNEYIGVSMGDVVYQTIGETRAIKKSDGSLSTNQLPFIKRVGYAAEDEFRVIYENSEDEMDFVKFDIAISMIESVNLSPWLPKVLVESTRDIIHSINGCQKLRVSGSTLTSNEEWKSFV